MSYQKLMSLEGKNIVVCGGSGLIGREVVKACAEFGANVINADLKPTDEDKNFVEFDLSTQQSVQLGLSAILEKVDGIDGWVNMAYPRNKDWGQPLEEVTQESWDWHLSSHLGGYFWINQAVLDHMKDNEKGALVNCASIYGVLGPNFHVYEELNMTNPPAYAAIKGAIVNMTRYMATYYGKSGVRVNCVSPGGIEDGQDPTFIDRYNSLTPLGRMGKPEEIAVACSYLLSDASSYITGQNLMIDGGWSAQ